MYTEFFSKMKCIKNVSWHKYQQKTREKDSDNRNIRHRINDKPNHTAPFLSVIINNCLVKR